MQKIPVASKRGFARKMWDRKAGGLAYGAVLPPPVLTTVCMSVGSRPDVGTVKGWERGGFWEEQEIGRCPE